MKQYTVTFYPNNVSVLVDEGTTLLQAQSKAGLMPDAPCAGKGSCGKCRVKVAGQIMLACQTPVYGDMTATIPQCEKTAILTEGIGTSVCADGKYRYGLAFDVGTTTVVAYLLDGTTGSLLSSASSMNPQTQYGADVISRIEYAMAGGADELQQCIGDTMALLTRQVAEQAGVSVCKMQIAAVAGNTAMHHLLFGFNTKPLITPPYMPKVFDALELPAEKILPFRGTIRVLPNIAGFVGGDTVGCMVATRFDELENLTLLIDIGTNGEMVLGDRKRRIACSTAAGPAFEGAKISCGMRGAAGAVDHVWLENGEVNYHAIGDGEALGLCGSGLLDLTAVLLETGVMDESGYLESGSYRLCDNVVLTQKDIREVQLAKAAIRAGIELLTQHLGTAVSEIRTVFLAGAFGNYLTPTSACRIGMIPPVLSDRIKPIGNAAGEGAKLCAVSRENFAYSQKIASNTEFLELASLPQFQDCYVDALEFSEETI